MSNLEKPIKKIYKKPKISSKRREKFSGGDDFPSMFTDLFHGVPWKVSLFLFVIMLFVYSDIYVELFLTSIDKAVEGDCPTSKGTLIQIITTIICYMALDLLVQGEFL
jgi:hypothetical protein